MYTYVNIYITIKKKLQRFLTCQSLNSRIDFGSKIQEDKDKIFYCRVIYAYSLLTLCVMWEDDENI